MTRNRVKVCPKINSHSAGCTILVNSSVWSCRSFCNSTTAKAPTRMAIPRMRRHPRGARTISTSTLGSTDTSRRPPAVPDRTQPSLRGVLAEIRARVVPEDVLECRCRSRAGGDMCLSRHHSFEFRLRTDCLQLTVVHQRHPIAQRIGLLHVVSGEQYRHPELVLHAPHLSPDTIARNGIQTDRRLVENQQRRSVDQRLRQLEAADHAAGVGACQPLGDVKQLHCMQRFVDPIGALGARHVVEPCEQFNVLPTGQCGFDRKLLRHIANVVSDVHGVPTRVEAEDENVATLDRGQCGQHAHHSGLTGSVGAEQPDRFAAAHLQAEIVDRGELAVAVRQVPTVDRKRRRHGCLSCSMWVISASTSSPRSRLSSWPGSSSSSTADSATRRAARDSSAMRCAGSVSRSRPTLRSSESTVRISRPSAASLDTSVEAVLGTSPNSVAASRTEIPGCRPTKRSISACDWVNPVASNPRPVDRRSCLRNRPTTLNSSAMRSVRVSTIRYYLCYRVSFPYREPGRDILQ